jgi:MFS family permease
MTRARLLFGISVFWLGLSMVFDGLNTLILPAQLLGTVDESARATTLGLITFAGLLAGLLVQPVADLLSDRLRPRCGRGGAIALGVLAMLAALAIVGLSRSVPALLLGYLLVQVAASGAQAAQQGYIPDLVPAGWRGTAAGLKGLMDLGGALLGFVVLGELLGGGGAGQALLALGATVRARSATSASPPRYRAHQRSRRRC